MARRTPTRTAPDPAPTDDFEEETLPRGALLPKIWAPVGGLLALAVVVLGVMVAFGVNGDESGPTFVNVTCDASQPGCELRQPVHWHADFAIFINGEQLRFDDPKYISTENQPLSGNIHIHDPRHTVVHIHREGSTWDEFLRSIGFELIDATFQIPRDQTCLKTPDGEEFCEGDGGTFKFFSNGVPVDGIAAVDVSDLDRVLISFGPESEEEARAQFDTVSDQACIPSGLCRDREPPEGEPPEPCSVFNETCN